MQEADTIHLTALKERIDARGNRDGPGKTQVIQRLIGVLRASPNSLRVIFLGAVSLSVLAVALALSLSKAQTPQVGDTAMPTIAISMSPGETATETDATATPLPVTIVAGSNTVLRSTPVPSLMPGWLVIASETAEARAVATQAVMDATATRQIATLLDCDKMDFEVLRPSDEVQTVAIAVTNVETHMASQE